MLTQPHFFFLFFSDKMNELSGYIGFISIEQPFVLDEPATKVARVNLVLSG